MSANLDPLRLPLHGSRLIEASAGTGKTWTIAAIYLRLVLGHGDDETAFARPLTPPEILVMTFTRAATRELSDRIRARLLQAARCFRGEAVPDPGDGLLVPLLAAFTPGAARAGAAWRLAAAAEAMGEAAVQTIDAWCQRMLREHAFDSGSLFDEELVADERGLVAEAALDYWRAEVYPLDGPALDRVLGVWKNAAALHEDVGALLGRNGPDAGDAAPALEELVVRLDAQRDALLAPHRADWRCRSAALAAWLDAMTAEGKGCPFNRAKLRPDFYRPWLLALTDWAHGDAPDPPVLPPKARERLRPDGVRDAFAAGRSVALPDHFDRFEHLVATLDALPDPKVAIRLHAATCIARRVVAAKARAGTFGFADLQERLATALEGPNGERLRERILAQHPVALVDEFQDTSPRQYRIFECLYRPGSESRAVALFLIGDPKQSIYGFRGADIHSYLRARRATAGRHHVLGVNHRSTVALVAAVNRVFEQAERRDAEGAFLFREPAGVDPVPFQPVAARGRRERLVRAGAPGSSAAFVPALTFCHDARLDDRKSSRRRFAAHAAEAIAVLLNDPRAGFATDAPAGGGFERLRPADIAVLVRTGREAAAVRLELGRRGVASVYLSDSESVFEGAEAEDMVHWLRAIADPSDARLARAAFAAPLTGLDLAELQTLASDEPAWERRLEDLRLLHGVWQRGGVLTMLRQLLHRLGLPARWLATSADGERRLTNVLHLAELLQAASREHDGEQALIRWFTRQIGGRGEFADERVVRLESDADRVRVITVHASKGLEFPVVFVPFATDYRPVDAKRGFVEVVDGEGRRSLAFSTPREVIVRADRERLREDLRLLYVALTRARHALWVGVAALKRGNAKRCTLHESALGRLLTGGAPAEAGQLVDLLNAVRGDAGTSEIALVAIVETPAVSRFVPDAAPGPLPAAPVYTGVFERDASIGSFSAMVRDVGVAGRGTPDPVRRHDEPAEAPEAGVVLRAAANAAWHRFPRGPMAGNFLHEQLNAIAGDGFDLEPEARRASLRRRCEQQGWGHRQDEVVDWLAALSRVVLPPLGASLRDLGPTLAEMEFWLPVERLATAEVDAVCRRHLLAGRDRPALPPQQIRGLLTGFADLVFEHGGRFWVLDYKSNALGPGDTAYTDEALEGAIAAHRYDVQAALYLLALHRLLRARIGAAYRPAQQLGGALVFFIRGLRAPNAGCRVLPADPTLLDELDTLAGAVPGSTAR